MDQDRLRKIYAKTDGHCHLCHKKLAFSHYSTGGWHVEHSVPRAKGGTDHMNNLYAACAPCNRDKGTKHTKTARSKNGVTRAPYSKAKKKAIRQENTTAGAVIGGIIGAPLGPLGVAIGAAVGGMIGNSNSPKK